MPYKKGESWILTEPSVFLALFNQDFIKLLSNSTEILDEEKEKIFYEEYKDNILTTTRRYYRLKENIIIDNVYQIADETSLEDFGVGFNSLVVRVNGALVDTCKYNKNNFAKFNSVKYFYVDYPDSFNDRIIEKEILKIAYRLPLVEALKIEKENLNCIKEKEQFDEASEYIRKNQKSYKKYCQKNPESNIYDFINYEKKQLVMRLVNTFNNKIEEKSKFKEV